MTLRRLALLVALIALAAYAIVPSESELAWHDACNVSRYDCAGLARPAILRSPLYGLLGVYGAGDFYVTVSTGVTDPRMIHAVAVHEMVHYLQWRHGVWKSTHESSCAIEEEAFQVSNAVLVREGYPDLQLQWKDVARFYACEAKENS